MDGKDMVSLTYEHKTWKRKDKRERNKRLIAYRAAHPDMTVRAIGKIFKISHVRVVQILKRSLNEV